VYGLVDSALAGDGARSARILQGLRAEGVAAPVVLWALAREIRQLLGMASELARGQGVAAVLARFRVWQARKTLLTGVLQRLSKAQCSLLLRQCAAIDRIIKGQAAGNPWDELLQLSLTLAGTPAITNSKKTQQLA
jgi:DNA polymerase-3 subunit delta